MPKVLGRVVRLVPGSGGQVRTRRSWAVRTRLSSRRVDRMSLEAAAATASFWGT